MMTSDSLVNPATGEIVEALDSLSDAEMFEAYSAAQDRVRAARLVYDRLEMALVNRLQARGATVAVADGWHVKLVHRLEYTHNDAVLCKLVEVTSPFQIQDCYRETRVWNQRALQQLAKVGGRVAAIIAEGTTVKAETWKPVLQRKDAAKGEPGAQL